MAESRATYSRQYDDEYPRYGRAADMQRDRTIKYGTVRAAVMYEYRITGNQESGYDLPPPWLALLRGSLASLAETADWE